MALSGNLGFVPLDEVLRLLARAGQKGALQIQGNDVDGRIFFTNRGISLATTHADSDLREHLINSQFVDGQQLAAAEGGVGTLKSVADDIPEFVQLLREMTVESIYQLSRNGATFEVDEDSVTPYASPKPFELEAVLSDASRRADEWAEVEALLSDMAGVIKIKRDLGDRSEVTVSRDAWKLLSELGSGSSVSEMASRLGTTEFWTARVASDLTSRDLLSVADTTSGSNADRVETIVEPPAVEEWIEEDRTEVTPEVLEAVVVEDELPQQIEDPSPEPPVASVVEEHAETADQPEVEAGAVDPDEDVDPNESWWVEPDQAESEAESTDESEPVEAETPSDDRRNRLGMFSPNLGGDDADENGDVEEDTEAFLEKVFSQLDEPEVEGSSEETGVGPDVAEDEEDDETSGHGLLRRRRLGSILTDSSKTND